MQQTPAELRACLGRLAAAHFHRQARAHGAAIAAREGPQHTAPPSAPLPPAETEAAAVLAAFRACAAVFPVPAHELPPLVLRSQLLAACPGPAVVARGLRALCAAGTLRRLTASVSADDDYYVEEAEYCRALARDAQYTPEVASVLRALLAALPALPASVADPTALAALLRQHGATLPPPHTVVLTRDPTTGDPTATRELLPEDAEAPAPKKRRRKARVVVAAAAATGGDVELVAVLAQRSFAMQREGLVYLALPNTATFVQMCRAGRRELLSVLRNGIAAYPFAFPADVLRRHGSRRFGPRNAPRPERLRHCQAPKADLAQYRFRSSMLGFAFHYADLLGRGAVTESLDITGAAVVQLAADPLLSF